MRGGARVGSGRPADPAAFRRDRRGDQLKDGWTLLPLAYDGPVPDWPLPAPTEREKVVWAREWQRPQASEWARCRLELAVAMHVRMLCEAERPGASAAIRGLVMRSADALGMTPSSLRTLRWVIRRPDEVPEPTVITRTTARGANSRFRDLLEPPTGA